MGRRIVAIICIMFLLFTITSPISGSIFSYGITEDTNVTEEEKLEAGLIVYLNKRLGYLVAGEADQVAQNTIDGVKGTMRMIIYGLYVDTQIGIPSYVYDAIKIYTTPFAVTMGSAATAFFNGVFDYCLDNGYFPNLYDNNNQTWNTGQTSDNVYDGYKVGNNLFYIINGNSYGWLSNNLVTKGGYIEGGTPGTLKNNFLSEYPNFNFNNTAEYSGNYVTNNSFNAVFSADYTYTYNILGCYIKSGGDSVTWNDPASRPILELNQNQNCWIYSDRNIKYRGGFCWFTLTGEASNKFHAGFVKYRQETQKYYFINLHTYTRQDDPNTNIDNTSINFDTDNFQTEPETLPPSGQVGSYVPTDKDTGNIYNNYNEYINNYIDKKTIIHKSIINDDEEPTEPNDPTGGTTPTWGDGTTTINPDGGGGYDVSLPDLTLPDLNIDWSINGLKDKFPFSIPWDLMAFFTVLNAEPETPEFTGEVDLGISVWDIDIDLHDFDLVAALVRNLEFIAFCIGLIIVTRSIIKG